MVPATNECWNWCVGRCSLAVAVVVVLANVGAVNTAQAAFPYLVFGIPCLHISSIKWCCDTSNGQARGQQPIKINNKTDHNRPLKIELVLIDDFNLHTPMLRNR